jgi:hypothetical protein
MRHLHTIADEIRADWKKVNYAAKPYLNAMSEMEDVSDPYGMSSGESVVRYFLSNASAWRGDTARRIKNELKEMIS